MYSLWTTFWLLIELCDSDISMYLKYMVLSFGLLDSSAVKDSRVPGSYFVSLLTNISHISNSYVGYMKIGLVAICVDSGGFGGHLSQCTFWIDSAWPSSVERL